MYSLVIVQEIIITKHTINPVIKNVAKKYEIVIGVNQCG